MKTLIELRKQKKMTQTDVATAVGVSLGGYRLWESGGGKPAYENRKKLAALFNIKMDEIIGG